MMTDILNDPTFRVSAGSVVLSGAMSAVALGYRGRAFNFNEMAVSGAISLGSLALATYLFTPKNPHNSNIGDAFEEMESVYNTIIGDIKSTFGSHKGNATTADNL